MADRETCVLTPSQQQGATRPRRVLTATQTLSACPLSNKNAPSRSPGYVRTGPGRPRARSRAPHGRLAAVSAALPPGLPRLGLTMASGRNSASPQPAATRSGGGWTTARRAPRPSSIAPGPRLQNELSPRSPRTHGPTASWPHPVQRVGPLVAALVFQPTAQHQGHGTTKVTCAATCAHTSAADSSAARSPSSSCAGKTELEASSATAGDGVPVDPAAQPGSGPPRTHDPNNPVRDVEPPSRGSTGADLRPRAPTDLPPEEFGRSWPPAARFRDHFLARSARGWAAANCSGCAAAASPGATAHSRSSRSATRPVGSAAASSRTKSPASVRWCDLRTGPQAIDRQLTAGAEPDEPRVPGREAAATVFNARPEPRYPQPTARLPGRRRRRRQGPGPPRPARPSDLRHTFATWLEDAASPPE